MKKVLVLFSGGLDSSVVLAEYVADKRIEKVGAITFDYGQSNRAEVACAHRLCEIWGVEYFEEKLRGIGKDATAEIPGRNTIFLARALTTAMQQGYDTVAAGWEPGSTYVDSSDAYIEAQREIFELHGLKLEAPVKDDKDKVHTLEKALDLGIPLDLIWSCRRGTRCWQCLTCKKYVDALHQLFPNVDASKVISVVTDVNIDLQYEHEPGEMVPDYYMNRTPTNSFKYLPAFFALAAEPLFSHKVVTTGNWGLSLLWWKMQYFSELYLDISIVELPLYMGDFGTATLNTDGRAAQWGIKQTLSRLPRPRYLERPLNYLVIQGHLSKAARDLGYEGSDPSGVRLHTEGW